MRRKELWRPELDESYKALCTYNKAITTMFFGDNLPQKVKKLSDTKKVHSKLYNRKMGHKRNYRSQPYPNSKPFLWNRPKRPQTNWWQPDKPFFYKKGGENKNKTSNRPNKQ